MPEPSLSQLTALERVARFVADVRLQHRRDNDLHPRSEDDGEGKHFVGYEVDPYDYQGRHRAAEVAAA